MSDWQIEFLETCCAGDDGVAVAEGAFGPVPAIWVGRREVAHFDGPRTLDVRLTRARIRTNRAALRDDSRVELRPNASDWIEVTMTSDADVAWARRLVADAIDANRPTAPAGPPPSGDELARRRRSH